MNNPLKLYHEVGVTCGRAKRHNYISMAKFEFNYFKKMFKKESRGDKKLTRIEFEKGYAEGLEA